MSSVNSSSVAHRPVTPQAAQASPSGSRQKETDQQAVARSDQPSVPNRPRATTEDRRGLSAHRQMINSTSSKAGASALAALAQSNNELRTGIKHLGEQASIEIQKLQQEIVGLTQQLNGASPSATGDAAVSAQSRGDRAGRDATAQANQSSSEHSPSASDSQASKGAAPHSAEQVVSDQTSIGQQLASLREELGSAFKRLHQALMELMQKISGGSATQSPSSDSTPSNSGARAQQQAPVNTSEASQAQTSSGSEDIDALSKENAKLHEEAKQLSEGVVEAVSMLKKQIAELKQQLAGKNA